MQNIGEVARSDGGVEKTDNSSDKVKPPLSAVSRSITGCGNRGDTEETAVSEERG